MINVLVNYKFVCLVDYIISSVHYMVYVTVLVVNFSYGTCDLLHMH
jgi:hypothetical protein